VATIVFMVLRDKRHRAMAASPGTTVASSSISPGQSEMEHKDLVYEAAGGERFEAPADEVRAMELPAGGFK